MQTKPECTKIMTFQNFGNLPDDQQTPGSTAFLHSQVVYPDAQGTPVNEYWELDGETGIGSRLSARHMARIISYMKVNGGYTIVQTQELFICLYFKGYRHKKGVYYHALEENVSGVDL